MRKDSENTSSLRVSRSMSDTFMVFIGNKQILSCRNLNIVEERYLMILIAQAAQQLVKYKRVAKQSFDPDRMICPRSITFSPKMLLPESSKNYDYIRKQAEGFASKTISFVVNENGKEVTKIVHLTGPVTIKEDDKKDLLIKLTIEDELWRLLLDMTDGYSYLDLKYLFRLSRPEAVRLLPMFYNSSLFKTTETVSETHCLQFNLNTLKKMFGQSDKYKTANGHDDYAGFMRRVVNPALQEIKESGSPYYADAILLEGDSSRRGKCPKNVLRFIPRRNLSAFAKTFKCILPENSPIRSPRVKKLLDVKYHFRDNLPQVENVVAFAQNYYVDDEELYYALYDMYPNVIKYNNQIAGFIDQVKKIIREKFGAEYVAPSKRGKKEKPADPTKRLYTDWELIQIDGDVELGEADNARLKALLEAQERMGEGDFKQLVELADSIQSGTIDTPVPGELRYGINSLTDEEIYNNVAAGLINDENVDGFYDEESYRRLEFIVGIQFECSQNKTAFTWELVKKRLAEKFHSVRSSINTPNDEMSDEEYLSMMQDYKKWKKEVSDSYPPGVEEELDRMGPFAFIDEEEARHRKLREGEATLFPPDGDSNETMEDVF